MVSGRRRPRLGGEAQRHPFRARKLRHGGRRYLRKQHEQPELPAFVARMFDLAPQLFRGLNFVRAHLKQQVTDRHSLRDVGTRRHRRHQHAIDVGCDLICDA